MNRMRTPVRESSSQRLEGCRHWLPSYRSTRHVEDVTLAGQIQQSLALV
jgi:hypothetical protein